MMRVSWFAGCRYVIEVSSFGELLHLLWDLKRRGVRGYVFESV